MEYFNTGLAHFLYSSGKDTSISGSTNSFAGSITILLEDMCVLVHQILRREAKVCIQNTHLLIDWPSVIVFANDSFTVANTAMKPRLT